MAGIAEVLADVQKRLEAPKGQYNSFGKYHYRSAEDILDALKKVLPVGCSVTLDDEIVPFGNRVYVKATATLRTGSEFVATTAFAREADDKKGMDESQITGAASSYARKYALNGLFAIDDAKDADATNDHGKNNGNYAGKPLPATKHPKNAREMLLEQLRHICGNDEGKAAVLVAAVNVGVTELKQLANQDEKTLLNIRDAANEIITGI